MVCLPKSQRILDVTQLDTHNEALLLKYLHKFFNEVDIPWVHLVWECYYRNEKLPNHHTLKATFQWRDILRLLDKFKGVETISINTRDTCFL
jgi:hypothetical protein